MATSATAAMTEQLEPIKRLTKDLRDASITLSSDEARFLVDAYYMMQEQRIRTAHQVRSLNQSGEPHSVIEWFLDQSETMEKQVARALDAYSLSSAIGHWSRSVCGIGPVIAAGLMAHIDIEKAPTVGHIWRFAGLDPTAKWGKGEKRPHNAALKTLCWKIGESFVKVKGNKNDVYGKIYEQRRQWEGVQNEKGAYADQAKAILESVPKHKQKKTYAEGKLPDGHLHARAKRYAVKLFLSHWHEVAYRDRFGGAPPAPYPIAIGGHAHKIEP